MGAVDSGVTIPNILPDRDNQGQTLDDNEKQDVNDQAVNVITDLLSGQDLSEDQGLSDDELLGITLLANGMLLEPKKNGDALTSSGEKFIEALDSISIVQNQSVITTLSLWMSISQSMWGWRKAEALHLFTCSSALIMRLDVIINTQSHITLASIFQHVLLHRVEGR